METKYAQYVGTKQGKKTVTGITMRERGAYFRFICDCGHQGESRAKDFLRFPNCNQCGLGSVKYQEADWVGKKSGSKSIHSLIRKRGRGTFFVCICDCGNTTTLNPHDFSLGGNCRKCMKNTARRKSDGFYPERMKIIEACKELGIPYCLSKAQQVDKFFNNARERKKDIKLNEKEVLSLSVLPCKYCGIVLDFMGIDRIDSARGYEPGNVAPCCQHCNIAKNDYTEQEFYDWARRLSKHLKLAE